MNKKILVLLALLLILSSMLSGCGDKTEQADSTSSLEEAESQTEKETEEVVIEKESLDIDYDNMTEEDLVEELIEDINNVSVDEYLSLLESFKYSKSNNFDEDLSISFGTTGKALAHLSRENAILPDRYETLEKALQSPEPVVRGKVLFYVAPSIEKDERIMAKILDLAKTEKDPYVIKEIASTLSLYMENKEVAKFMFESSNHDHPAIRFEAIEGLSLSEGIDGSLERIIEMMDDEDEEVRKKAYRRVGHLRDDGAIDYIVEVLMDPEKTDYHEDCMTSLVQLWLGYPFYEQKSEKAYNATIDYLNYSPRSKDMPYFKAINFLNQVKRKNKSDIESFEEWKGNSSYYNSDDLVEPMFQIAKDPEIYYLACEYAIEVVNNYGSKEDFAKLKGVLETSTHPEKEKVLETYNKIAEKN